MGAEGQLSPISSKQVLCPSGLDSLTFLPLTKKSGHGTHQNKRTTHLYLQNHKELIAFTHAHKRTFSLIYSDFFFLLPLHLPVFIFSNNISFLSLNHFTFPFFTLFLYSFPDYKRFLFNFFFFSSPLSSLFSFFSSVFDLF